MHDLLTLKCRQALASTASHYCAKTDNFEIGFWMDVNKVVASAYHTTVLVMTGVYF